MPHWNDEFDDDVWRDDWSWQSAAQEIREQGDKKLLAAINELAKKIQSKNAEQIKEPLPEISDKAKKLIDDLVAARDRYYHYDSQYIEAYEALQKYVAKLEEGF